MARSLDFNKLQKQYLTVKLADENKTTLLIGTPNKKLMDDLTLLRDAIDGYSEDGTDAEQSDALYLACAKVMSCNKGGIKITKEFLEELFDFEDITIFFRAYMEFVSDLADSKN